MGKIGEIQDLMLWPFLNFVEKIYLPLDKGYLQGIYLQGRSVASCCILLHTPNTHATMKQRNRIG